MCPKYFLNLFTFPLFSNTFVANLILFSELTYRLWCRCCSTCNHLSVLRLWGCIVVVLNFHGTLQNFERCSRVTFHGTCPVHQSLCDFIMLTMFAEEYNCCNSWLYWLPRFHSMIVSIWTRYFSMHLILKHPTLIFILMFERPCLTSSRLWWLFCLFQFLPFL